MTQSNRSGWPFNRASHVGICADVHQRELSHPQRSPQPAHDGGAAYIRRAGRSEVPELVPPPLHRLHIRPAPRDGARRHGNDDLSHPHGRVQVSAGSSPLAAIWSGRAPCPSRLTMCICTWVGRRLAGLLCITPELEKYIGEPFGRGSSGLQRHEAEELRSAIAGKPLGERYIAARPRPAAGSAPPGCRSRGACPPPQQPRSLPAVLSVGPGDRRGTSFRAHAPYGTARQEGLRASSLCDVPPLGAHRVLQRLCAWTT